jgi:hypothetical protein
MVPEGKALVLKWIGEGPEEACSDDFRARWELRRLSAVKDELPPEQSARYQELKARYTGREEPAQGGYWEGPRSPKEGDELARMEVQELSCFLRDWRPDPGPCLPSPEGLGRVLRAVIASKAEKYAAAADQFVGLQPTYVRALVSGLCDGLKGGRPFDWGPVVSLCEWAVRQPRDLVSDALNSEWADRDWRATRHEITHLLWQGLGGRKAGVPFHLRAPVWSVIEVLLEDPDPSPEAEAECKGTSICPVTLSFNAVRSEALRTAIGYGLWCMLSLKGADVNRPEDSPGLGAMPELGRALESHLDTDQERSLAVRSVYGEWFPQLVLLDYKWASEHVEAVFPTARGWELLACRLGNLRYQVPGV